jgi:drug/metabolite transporter (DMT)-like permease
VFYASSVCVNKRLAARFTAEEQVVYPAFVSCLAVLPFAPPTHGLPLHGVALCVLGGAIAGTVAGVLFVRGVARIPAEHAALLTFLEPLTAVAIGIAVFHERSGPVALVGAAVVIAAGIEAAVVDREPTAKREAG